MGLQILDRNQESFQDNLGGNWKSSNASLKPREY